MDDDLKLESNSSLATDAALGGWDCKDGLPVRCHRSCTMSVRPRKFLISRDRRSPPLPYPVEPFPASPFPVNLAPGDTPEVKTASSGNLAKVDLRWK